jgi:hypothetical protein
MLGNILIDERQRLEQLVMLAMVNFNAAEATTLFLMELLWTIF